jgi:hypothetical protein
VSWEARKLGGWCKRKQIVLVLRYDVSVSFFSEHRKGAIIKVPSAKECFAYMLVTR